MLSLDIFLYLRKLDIFSISRESMDGRARRRE
jgi:hypothetical protein